MKKGSLIVISGPSGCGKGTILKKLMENNNDRVLSISVTTRPPREGEVHGKDYYFSSVDQFEELLKSDMIIEHAIYCGHYYGTPKKYIEENLDAGIDVILEIEVQGAFQIKSKIEDAVLIFLMPPSVAELKRRLMLRNTDDMDTVLSRIETAIHEMNLSNDYDYILVNDDVHDCVHRLNNIIDSLKYKSMNMKKFVDEVLNNA